MAILAIELTWIFQHIARFHLWGSFLLDAARATVLPTGDSHQYEKLLKTIMSSEPAFPSMLAAAEDIVAAAQGENGHMSAEDRNLLQIASEACAAFGIGTETAEDEPSGTGTEDEGIDTESPEAGDAKKRSKSKQRVVKIIHIKPGYESVQLRAKGKPPLCIDGKLLRLFLPFARRIANDVSGETVLHLELNEAVGKENEPKRATDAPKNAMDELNDKLNALGCPEDGKEFILNVSARATC